jgi:hypothetical protein
MVNDLIGLRHKTAAKFFPGCTAIDCLGLFVETRKRLGLYDYESDFQWVYEQMHGEQLPLRKIAKAMRAIAQRVDSPKEGDLAVMQSASNTIGLGVVINGGILTITETGPSFWSDRIKGAKFWTPIEGIALN